jgi:hemoglobin-like flavoprotein
MTDRQRDLVQSTWEYVLPLADIAVELFYAELFRRDPSLRDFIADKLSAQKRILVPGFAILVRGLDDLDTFLPALRQLGRRHPDHGVHYAAPDSARAALLHTLREILGPLFTPEVEEAWTAVYDLIATTAAADHPRAAA